MIVEHRNPELKYPPHVSLEKTRIVLDWLLEFRFSSLDILAKRIGLSKTNSNRFFNRLCDDNMIQYFKNVHTGSYRYVLLASTGVNFLESNGRDISSANTRVAGLKKYIYIIHDLSVQQAILDRIDNLSEVISEGNFTEQYPERPDALVRSKKGSLIAIEYERWRKQEKRIYKRFIAHSESIATKKYSGVMFFFENNNDLKYYKALFSAREWPIVKNTKQGKYVRTGNSFLPDKVEGLRKAFNFVGELSLH